jgi:3-dehydroquinate synthase
LWAFGGGVIGDITGFLASIYMRGIRYFQIPTTLLSMVDSSVGGKTGVNIEGGKNMMGTFYQPSAVFINTSFLKTLADREFKSGLSEVIKSALLNDPELFHLIENNVNSLSRENVNLNENISMMSVKVKADVVSKDEKENDLRAILNLGHTLAHALESFYQYRNISHGEAVSIGIAFAVFLAVDLNILSHEILERIHILFKNLGMMYLWSHLPGAKPEVEIIIELMKGDKKNINNNIRFVFISDIGKFLLPQPVELPRIKSCLEKFICH